MKIRLKKIMRVWWGYKRRQCTTNWNAVGRPMAKTTHGDQGSPRAQDGNDDGYDMSKREYV